MSTARVGHGHGRWTEFTEVGRFTDVIDRTDGDDTVMRHVTVRAAIIAGCSTIARRPDEENSFALTTLAYRKKSVDLTRAVSAKSLRV